MFAINKEIGAPELVKATFHNSPLLLDDVYDE